MKLYLIRVVKYILQLVVLFFVMYGLLLAFGSSEVPLSEMFASYRGYVLVGAVLFFAILQPFFGFTTKALTFDASNRTEELDRVMNMCGYKRVGGTPQSLVYRAEGLPKKLATMWEDQVTVTTSDGLSLMNGPRKEVVKAVFRTGTYIS
ncbi:MAG: hypothetical protein RR931_04630 [Mucinivorans sp.]